MRRHSWKRPLIAAALVLNLVSPLLVAAATPDSSDVAADSATTAPETRHTSAAIASCQVGARIASEVGFPLGFSIGATVCVLGIIMDAQDLLGR